MLREEIAKFFKLFHDNFEKNKAENSGYEKLGKVFDFVLSENCLQKSVFADKTLSSEDQDVLLTYLTWFLNQLLIVILNDKTKTCVKVVGSNLDICLHLFHNIQSCNEELRSSGSDTAHHLQEASLVVQQTVASIQFSVGAGFRVGARTVNRLISNH